MKELDKIKEDFNGLADRVDEHEAIVNSLETDLIEINN